MNRRDFLRVSGAAGVLFFGGYARDTVASEVPRTVGSDFQRRFDLLWDYLGERQYLPLFVRPYTQTERHQDRVGALKGYGLEKQRLANLAPYSDQAAGLLADQRVQSAYAALGSVFWESPAGDLYNLFDWSNRFAERAKDPKLNFTPEEQADLAGRIGNSESLGWLTRVISAAERHLLYLEALRPPGKLEIEAYRAGELEGLERKETDTYKRFAEALAGAAGPIHEYLKQRDRSLKLARGGVDAIEAARRKTEQDWPVYLQGVRALEESVRTECVSEHWRYSSLGESWESLALFEGPRAIERAIVHYRRLRIQSDDPGEQAGLDIRIEQLEQSIQPPEPLGAK